MIRAMPPVIALFTDFGIATPYGGQMKLVLAREAPDALVIDLCHDVPPFDARAAAYLLPSYVNEFPEGTVFLCVVDPGVGDESRRPVVVRACERWYVGPDNGLFNEVSRRASVTEWWDITWRPMNLSASFHGRDLFAPVAARLSRGEEPPGVAVDPASRIRAGVPEDLAEIIYVDRYGNAITGLRAATLGPRDRLLAAGHEFARVRTFADVGAGQGLWYENANGLAEIAVNQGRADVALGLAVGVPVEVRHG